MKPAHPNEVGESSFRENSWIDSSGSARQGLEATVPECGLGSFRHAARHRDAGERLPGFRAHTIEKPPPSPLAHFS